MKKLLFLLLFPLWISAQVSTGQEQDFDYGIKNNAAQTVTSAVNLVTQGTDGTYGKITFDNLTNRKAFLSTGLIKNGLITINADPTKYNISAGIGIISNFDDPQNPVSTLVNFSTITGHTPAYLNTGNITYIAINSSGAIVESASQFTTTQRRDLIILGAVIHSNLTSINVVNNIAAPSNAIGNQLHDFMEAIGALNLTGNKYTAAGANLQLNKSAGTIFKFGVNFATDWKNPHQLAQGAGTSLTFRYRTQNGTEGSDRINLDPSLYDVSNVLTAVPNNKFTIQTVTVFQTGLTRIQYGQTVYDDLASAQSAIFTRDFVVENNILMNGIVRAYVIMKNSTTSLQSATDVKIIEAQKFGGVASGGVALTFANIVTALGFTPENAANKQDNLTDGGTGNIRYPTVNAVSAGLALKADLAAAGLADRLIKFDSSGKIQYTNLISDSNFNFTKFKVENPTAPTATDSGITGVLNGTYYYSVSYYNSVGETLANNSSSPITVSSKQIQLSSIPLSLDSTVLGRRIYRSEVNANEAVDGKKLVADIPNNTTTTYLDNIADGSLGVSLKWNNTTAGVYQQNGITIFDTDLNNLQVGFGAKSTGYANTAVGSYALGSNTTGKRNSAFSLYALTSNTTGYENTAGGVHALNYNVTGYGNSAWGYASFFYNTGSTNTGVGNRVFEANASGSGNVGIGYQAGDKETGSNKFYVDNQSRGAEALGRTGALLYGEFNSTVASQTLRANAQLSALNLSGTNTGDQLQSGVSDIKDISFPQSTFFASGANPSNSPTGSDVFVQGIQFPVGGSNLSFKQILASNQSDLYYIGQSSGTWGNWAKIYSSANSNLSYVDWTANNLTATSYTGGATLTGTPTAPTATAGTSTTQIATTAFVQANKSKLSGYTVATLPTGTIGDLAYVTDASGFTYNSIVAGGGSGVTIVFFDGTNWRTH